VSAKCCETAAFGATQPTPQTTDNAEDFKQGAMFEKAADTHAADGTLLKIPLC
jgi:hypothetical protein